MGKCIIVSAGDFVPVDLNIEEGDYCIACDAGFFYLEKMGILPDLIVGDFDSTAEMGEHFLRSIEEIKENDPDRVISLQVHKDDTDTLTAVKIGLEKGFKKFFLYGALGGERLGHTLANLQTLLFIKNYGATGYIMEDKQMVLVAKDETIKFHKGMTGMLSIFAMGDKAEGVYEKGLMYSLDDATVTNDFPIGVSNEFIIDEEAVITVRHGTLLILIRF